MGRVSANAEQPEVRAARERLVALRGHWPDVAKAAGLSYSWVQKFGYAQIPNPTVNSLAAVVDGIDRVAAIVAQLPSRQASAEAALSG
jgi:hypothetical protein